MHSTSLFTIICNTSLTESLTMAQTKRYNGGKVTH